MNTSTTDKNHWLDIAETSAVVISLGGSITGFVLKQWLWATVPLTVTAGLSVLNHQRLKQLIKTDKEAIELLIQENQTRINKLKEKTEQNHWDNKSEIASLQKATDANIGELEQLLDDQKTKLGSTTEELQTLQSSVASLDSLAHRLEQEQIETRKLAAELKSIEKFTQMINRDGGSAQAYYKRGSAYQRTDNIERAIEDFTKAVELRRDYVKAYHKRGLLYLKSGQPRQAIIDLRRASQYYLSKGELEKYRETRDLSLQIHLDQSDDTNAASAIENDNKEVKTHVRDVEPVAVSNVFG